MSPAPLRGLVVDDDLALVEYLGEILGRLGILHDVAMDGREAEQRLRESRYDVLFLDLKLPILSGTLLVHLINQGVIHRPGAIVLMSGQPDLVQPTPTEMGLMRVAGFLGKPFGLEDVKAALGSTVRPDPDPVRVLIAGVGLWAASLAQVVRRSQGEALMAGDAAAAFSIAHPRPPQVAVLGPPLGPAEMLSLTRLLHQGKCHVLVGQSQIDSRLKAELLRLGAHLVLPLPDGLPELYNAMVLLAGMPRRSHPRAPLSGSVLLHGKGAVVGGLAVDLSEGGLGLAQVPEKLPAEVVMAEFTLPREEEAIEAPSQIVWTRPAHSGFRAGVRFLDLPGPARERIRRYVVSSGSTD